MENKKEIFAPRFDGSRFENHTMPLELLEDLKVLQEMTVEMAKFLYLQQNDRQRVPKNFSQGISFELEGLEPGSTIPKVIMTFALAGMFPEGNVTYFERASEQIKEVIQIASEDGNISENAPSSVLTYFNRFGKKLREDEHIEFRPEHSEKKARFTRNTRRKLISASSTSGEYTEEVAVKGVLCEMDKNKRTFQIQLANKKKISGSFDEALQYIFLEAFSASDGNQKVSINGTGLFSFNEKLKELKSVEELSLLDNYDLGYRLDEIAALKEGWYNGQGLSFDRNQLLRLEGHLELLAQKIESTTYIFPTPDGKLQLEWPDSEIDVELELNSSKAHIYGITEDPQEFSILDKENWMALVTKLKAVI